MGWISGSGRRAGVLVLAALLALPTAGHAPAADVRFESPGADRTLSEALRGASLILQAERDGRTGGQDLYAAARAEYARLLGALYAAGHYSGVVSIRLDGREAAAIAPLDAPARIATVAVEVRPGRSFRLGEAAIGPLAPGAGPPDDFRPGSPAPSGSLRAAAQSAVDGWRDAGHARARIAAQTITADHADARLDARIAVAPGPVVRLGALRFSGAARMRPDRLRAIAGFPEGDRFSPATLARVADRLRRTGVFRSVALVEDEALGPGNTLAVDAQLAEELPRRFGFGAEVSSFDGLNLSAYWLHRNLFGGAERLRIEAEVEQIGARRSGTDYRLGVAFDRPATLTPDTTLNLTAEVARVDDEDQRSDIARAGLALTHRFSERLTVRGGITLAASDVADRTGAYSFRVLALPIGVAWDSRDNPFDATKGVFVDAEIRPFKGFSGTGSGGRLALDARAYRSLGTRLVLAGRLQAGAIVGSGVLNTPRDFLFYSGGGGTVRGQPYQSLGVNILRIDQKTGGTHFIGASVELRARLGARLGAVAFADWGRVEVGGFFDGAGDSHAGAGIGLRYSTGLGPIRLDVAAPVSGRTGRGVQVYVGIGQAF
jgi:translocation and assembly module TamA